MLVRRALPSEFERVADVLGDSFATLTFLPRLHSGEERLAFVRDVLFVRDEVWVAEHEGRVVGFAAIHDDLLGHLYVDPAAQGLGAGSALFAQVQARRPEGFSFWVFQENARARRFYEARGARVVRLTDGSGNEERSPDALYEWRPPG